MQKLKLGELNPGGAEVLTKEQMKMVVGGLSSDNQCIVKIYDSGNNLTRTTTLEYPDGTSCGSQSYSTSVWASEQIPTGGSAHYDCGCDGWGV